MKRVEGDRPEAVVVEMEGGRCNGIWCEQTW